MKLSVALLLSLHCVFVLAGHDDTAYISLAAANETDIATWEACIRDPRRLECNTATSCSNTCVFSRNGYCTDGRPGAYRGLAECAPGTDCADCTPELSEVVISGDECSAYFSTKCDGNGSFTSLGLSAPNGGTIPTQIGLLPQLSYIYLSQNRLSGTLPTQVGLLPQLSWLYPSDNRMSGTLPTQIGRLTRLTHLYAGAVRPVKTLLSGTLPTEVGLLANVSDLWVAETKLSGTLPTQIGLLANISAWLNLHANVISGTIPTEFGLLTKLPTLHLQENRLNGTVPALPPAVRTFSINFNRLDPDLPDAVLDQCFDSTACFGLPPFGCSAFGDERRASASGAWDQCVECPSEADGQYTLRTVGPLAGVVLAGALAAAVYVWAVQRYSDFKGWIATSSIILTYVQVTYRVASDLRSVGGPLIRFVESVLSFGTSEFSLGRPECVFSVAAVYQIGGQYPSDIFTILIVNGVILGCLLLVLGVLFGISVVFNCKKKAKAKRKSDSFADKTVIVYSLQFSPAVQIGVRSLALTGKFIEKRQTQTVVFLILGFFGVLVVVNIAIGLWMIVRVRRLVKRRETRQNVRLALKRALGKAIAVYRLQMSRMSRKSTAASCEASCSWSSSVPAAPSSAASGELPGVKQQAGADGEGGSRRGKRGCCTRQTISSHRQARRLRYLSAKYGEHAPYWQFVKWLRSLLFCLARALPQALVGPVGDGRPLAQALGSLAVLIVFGLLHVRYQPYAEKHQNRLELVLIVSTACATLLSCAYPYVDGDAAKYAIDVLMLLLMFGPVVALLLWWGVACFKRRSRLSRFTRARSPSRSQAANAASIELDTESNTTPPAWGEQNRVQSRKAVMS